VGVEGAEGGSTTFDIKPRRSVLQVVGVEGQKGVPHPRNRAETLDGQKTVRHSPNRAEMLNFAGGGDGGGQKGIPPTRRSISWVVGVEGFPHP